MFRILQVFASARQEVDSITWLQATQLILVEKCWRMSLNEIQQQKTEFGL